VGKVIRKELETQKCGGSSPQRLEMIHGRIISKRWGRRDGQKTWKGEATIWRREGCEEEESEGIILFEILEEKKGGKKNLRIV